MTEKLMYFIFDMRMLALIFQLCSHGCVPRVSAAAVGGVVQPGGAGDAAAGLPRAQALVPAVPLRAAADRQDRARPQDGLDQDQEAAGRREKGQAGQFTHSLIMYSSLH